MAKLIAVAAKLPTENAECAKAQNFYAIYNTIGYLYYQRNQPNLAKTHFLLAYAKRSELSSDTRGELFDNLGIVSYQERNYLCAACFFGEARSIGLPDANAHLTMVMNVLKSANDTRNARKSCSLIQ